LGKQLPNPSSRIHWAKAVFFGDRRRLLS
jgi:hypothetical protein